MSFFSDLIYIYIKNKFFLKSVAKKLMILVNKLFLPQFLLIVHKKHKRCIGKIKPE